MFSDDCEMGYGEQAALIGILDLVQPRVAVEIGTYTGGSLALIAARAERVHTFDLVSHVDERLPNVEYHIGDSSTEVPRVLDLLDHVDFVLIDGDHARQGVRRDVGNVLTAPAARDAVIVLHDVANEAVRAGVRDALRGRELAYANLSFVPPSEQPGPLRESWGGLGILVLGNWWSHRRRVDANVYWPSAVRQTGLWHLARPIRAAARAAGYRLRPAIRNRRGVRGVHL